MLCSPRFLYLDEPEGELDDFALASRLSYFLWNTMPDEALFADARAGTLEGTGNTSKAPRSDARGMNVPMNLLIPFFGLGCI